MHCIVTRRSSLNENWESMSIMEVSLICVPTTVHDPDYRTSWNDWTSFVESLTEKIAEKDETIPELPPKDLVFRIYRDVRFSSDPTPYKVRSMGGEYLCIFFKSVLDLFDAC